jgi:hypothetical protein
MERPGFLLTSLSRSQQIAVNLTLRDLHSYSFRCKHPSDTALSSLARSASPNPEEFADFSRTAN